MKAFTKKIVDHLPHNIPNPEEIDKLRRIIVNRRIKLAELEALCETTQSELLSIDSKKANLAILESILSQKENALNALRPHIDRLKEKLQSLSEAETECEEIIALLEGRIVDDPDFKQLFAIEQARLEELRRDSERLSDCILYLEEIESSVQ